MKLHFYIINNVNNYILVVIVTLYPIASYLHLILPIAMLIALTVCLIPTTIGGLLSAIGIAGMDRVTQFNVLAKSGRAVEVCGDVDVMILDKTGTITYGNRIASEFLPVNQQMMEKLIVAAYMSSIYDDTPEGKSIVRLAKQMYLNELPKDIDGTYKPLQLKLE